MFTTTIHQKAGTVPAPRVGHCMTGIQPKINGYGSLLVCGGDTTSYIGLPTDVFRCLLIPPVQEDKERGGK